MSPSAQEISSIPGPWSRVHTTLSVVRRPLAFYRELFARYGDPVRLKTLNGRIVLTGRPELAREILSAPPEVYDAFAASALEGLLGRHSLLVLSGAPHKRARKYSQPAFLGERMRAYASTVVDIVDRYTRGWKAGDTFTVHAMSTAVTLEVIVRAIFGIEDDEEVGRFHGIVSEIMDNLLPLFFFSRQVQVAPFGLGPWADFLRRLAPFDEAVYAQIARRRAEPGQDILSMLIASSPESSDEELRDQLVTLLVAGHETTALVVAWAFYHLHRHRETLETLRDELDAHRDLAPEAKVKLPYLRAVCYEALRLHPVVADFVRAINQDVELMGLRIPAGYGVCVATSAMHHDPEIYAQPERFWPERFLEDKPPKWAYFPFGGGHRRCVGAAFATFELALVLAEILGRFELELRCGEEEVRSVRRNITMGPSSPIPMRVLSRRR